MCAELKRLECHLDSERGGLRSSCKAQNRLDGGGGLGSPPRAPERGEQGGVGAEGLAAWSLHVREQG